MSEELAGDRTAARYLLGRMTDEESASLEQKMLVNREVFDEVMAAEDDLIDAYLEGGLSPDERLRFERLYLSAPERRARVEFARALREKLGRERTAPERELVVGKSEAVPRVRHRGLAWLAAAAAVFAAFGAYLAMDGARLRREVVRLREEKASAIRRDADAAARIADLRSRGERFERDLDAQRQESSRLSDEIAALRGQGGRIVSFLLTATSVREGGTLQTLAVSGDAASVRLTVPVTPGTSYASWRAVVQSPEGRSHWAGTGTWPASAAKTIVVTVPAKALPPGDYILSLTGVMASGQREPAADFSFRVKRV